MFGKKTGKYAVIGLGLFGKRLALALSEQGHEVLAIDKSEDPVRTVRDDVDKAIIGDVRQENLFNEFITPEFDAVIVTMATNLEASLLSVLHSKEIGVEKIIAKSSGPDHTIILRRLGISEIIMPEEDMADRLAQQVGNPNVHEYLQLKENHSMMEMVVPDFFVGKDLMELNLRNEFEVQVIGVQRGGKGKFNYVPSPNRPFEEEDVVWITGPEETLQKLSTGE